MSDDRTRRVLAHIDPGTMRGVEVGPSFSPFVRKADGADVVVVDHADAATLRDKYRHHGVAVDAIEDVDVVWRGGSLSAALAGRAPFDYVIASHLLEHVTDPLGFLADCEALLRPGGVVSLVLPDHRSCFDVLRPPTTFGQWIDAHLGERSRHTPGTVFDHWVHAAQREGIVWPPASTVPLSMVHRRVDLDEAVAAAVAGDEYVDVHAWVFNPASFVALVSLATSFGHTSFELVEASDAVGFEFFVTLRRPVEPPTPEARAARFDDRLALFEAAALAEHAAWRTAPAPPPPGLAARVRAARADGRLATSAFGWARRRLARRPGATA